MGREGEKGEVYSCFYEEGFVFTLCLYLVF